MTDHHAYLLVRLRRRDKANNVHWEERQLSFVSVEERQRFLDRCDQSQISLLATGVRPLFTAEQALASVEALIKTPTNR